MSYSFPLAFMANTFAMTCLLIALGLTGNSGMAADVGIVQGATLALFYAFSANARSLILNNTLAVSAQSIMIGRLLLLVPLAAISYWLSVDVAGVNSFLAFILIGRRCVEWLGEVHLSEMERLGEQGIAQKYLFLQSGLLAAAFVWIISGLPFHLLGLFIWAFLPLLFSAKFIWKSVAATSNALTGVVGKILPHLGSTAIIGITVYVFRLLIFLLIGKETAGDLYTAFAIGGLTGSVFANALGASIALHEQRSGKPYFPALLRHALNFSLVLGIVIFIAGAQQFSALVGFGKSYFFWEATGLSMIGGVIMVYAQRLRFSLLQHDEEHDVFGPDVLMNVLLISSVPFIFFLFGQQALSTMYLLSSVMAYAFYMSARKEKTENETDESSPLSRKCLRMLIAAMLLLPLFFQISHGVFRDPSMSFDSGGILRELPIPLSVVACYGGILIFGAYKRAFISFGFIFLTCVLMVMSAIILTQGQPELQQAKFILLIQFILPMLAMALGQVFQPLKIGLQDDSFAKAFLWVLLIVVPIQLLFTLGQGLGYLSPNLGLFSIYQHLQYVPIIFVAAYLIALFSLWNITAYKIALVIFLPFMACYVTASISILAMGLLFSGLLIFALFQLRKNAEKLPLLVLSLALAFSWGYFQYENSLPAFKFGFFTNATMESNSFTGNTIQTNTSASNHAELEIGSGQKIIPTASQRLDYWEYYAEKITISLETLLLGTVNSPSRLHYPSAHNYYLDFIYNFGALALLPLLSLLVYSIVQIYRYRRTIVESSSLLVLCMTVVLLLIADNSLKVGLRQPYSGIFTFFLWGVLLTELSKIKNNKVHV